MNALNKLSELWHTSVNLKARPVVEGEHDKSWNDHGPYLLSLFVFFLVAQGLYSLHSLVCDVFFCKMLNWSV